MHDFLPILSEFHTPALVEVLINADRSIDRIFFDRRTLEPSPFHDNAELTRRLQKFALAQHRRLDPLWPFAGGELLYQGHHLRWHLAIPPASYDGPVASFRRHRLTALHWRQFAGSAAVMRELGRVIGEEECPVFFCGPTGSGKTTLMVSLLSEFAATDRTVFFEAIPEIPLLYPLWLRFVERPDNQDGVGAIEMMRLAQEALRLRPDRLVVGELRGREVEAFHYLLTAGHKGVYSTIHIGSAQQLPTKLAQLSSIAVEEWRDLFRSLQPVVVQLTRSHPPCVKALSQFTGETFEELT